MKKRWIFLIISVIVLTAASVLSICADGDYTSLFSADSGIWVEGGFAENIKPGTTAGELLAHISYQGQTAIEDAEGGAVAVDSAVATGMRLVLTSGGAEDRLTLVVKGDVNGDGLVTTTDYIGVKQYFNSVHSPAASSFRAADINSDSRITALDYLRIKAYFNGQMSLSDDDSGESGAIKLLEPANGARSVHIANEAVQAVVAMKEYTTDNITPYGNGKYNNYAPAEVTFSWEGSDTEYVLQLSALPDFAEAESYRVSGNSVKLTTLYRGTTYYWKVTGKSGAASGVRRFTTADELRTISIDGVSNTRDIGGYMTEDGMRCIKQGYIYRGASPVNITEQGLSDLMDTYGVTTALDLTGGSATIWDPPETLKQYEYYILWYDMMFRPEYASTAINNNLRDVLRLFTDESNFPIYYNCSLGRDRTATLTYLLLCVCGVSEEDIDTDFALSYLSDKGDAGNDSTIESLFNALGRLKTKMLEYGDADASMSEHVKSFMLYLGLTEEEIEAIKANITEPCIRG